jgi:hypothetical protein
MTTFADHLMIAWRDRTAPIPVLRLAKRIEAPPPPGEKAAAREQRT